MLQDRQQDIMTVLHRRADQGPLSGAHLGSDDFEQSDADVQEDIDVALFR